MAEISPATERRHHESDSFSATASQVVVQIARLAPGATMSSCRLASTTAVRQIANPYRRSHRRHHHRGAGSGHQLSSATGTTFPGARADRAFRSLARRCTWPNRERQNSAFARSRGAIPWRDRELRFGCHVSRVRNRHRQAQRCRESKRAPHHLARLRRTNGLHYRGRICPPGA